MTSWEPCSKIADKYRVLGVGGRKIGKNVAGYELRVARYPIEGEGRGG